MDVALPLLAIIAIGALSIIAATRTVRPEERRWLATVLMLAFLIRLTIATVFAIVPSTRLFHEDADGYERIGMATAAGWHHEGPPYDPSYGRPQNFGYFYITSAIYYVFGWRARPAPSYVNCLLGMLLVFLVYRLARRFFKPIVARRAALLTAFIPSMILWSSTALKDTLTTLLIVVSLSACIELKRKMSFGALCMTLVPILAVQPIRFYLFYFLILAVMVSLTFERGLNVLRGAPKQLIVLSGALVLIVVAGAASSVSEGAEFLSLERANAFRQGMAATANSGFAQDADISTPGGALLFLPVGIAVLLFSPFPWQFTSLRAALAGPEMVIWWLLIPSLLRGIRYVVRRRLVDVSPILVFGGLLTVAYSLIHGNVGSGFRQRAQIFVFLFIFASFGTYLKRAVRRGLDPAAALEEPSERPPRTRSRI